VLLHGFPQHAYMWVHLMPLLATRFRVLAPDLRGMGGSDVPGGGYDKRTMAADLERLLTGALRLDRVHLLGYDQGPAWRTSSRRRTRRGSAGSGRGVHVPGVRLRRVHGAAPRGRRQLAAPGVPRPGHRRAVHRRPGARAAVVGTSTSTPTSRGRHP
jgi:pimeloyl-ACP methyl ester carboxylesterase